MWPRAANAVLGAWVAASAFLFRDSRRQVTNDVLCGLLAILFAAVGSLSLRSARLLNVLVGTWLLASAVIFRHASVAGAWNQGVVGYLLVAFAFIPRGPSRDVEPTAPVNW